MKEENVNFLVKINFKTNRILRLFPGLLGVKSFDFKDYLISKEKFKKILRIIREESLSVENRFVEFYCVCNVQGQTILQFGKNNITEEMEKALTGLAQK